MLTAQDVIEFKGAPLFERAKITPPLKHPAQFNDLACFFYMVEGEYEAIESHGAFRIGKKEALIKKCGNYISEFINTKDGKECQAVAVYLYPDLFREIYKNEIPSFLKTPEHPIPPRQMIANELIDKYISNLLVYFDNPSLIDEDLAILKLKELVMILLKSEQYQSVQGFFQEIFAPGYLEFSRVVENNIFSPISIEELAFISNKSLSSFKREFKKVYKETPARYIKKRRLHRAAELLASPDDSISRIAFQCGFQDPSTFSVVFQEEFGVTPTKYRLNHSRKMLA